MRMKGRFYEAKPGTWTCYPTTRKDALDQQIVFYRPIPNTNPCRRNGHEADSVIYARTNISRCCSIRDSFHDYDEAVKNNEPLDPGTASVRGLDYFWQPEPGKHCGHSGKVTLDGKCYICHTVKPVSPRQQAIDAGESWYMPDELCQKCGKIALKSVANGRCKGCQEDESEPDIYKMCPDMVISRQDAQAAGMIKYRTGKECVNGHSGWRYVINGNCTEC